MNKIKVLCFDTINVSERINDYKTNASKVCDICHYLHFLNFRVKFQPDVCKDVIIY